MVRPILAVLGLMLLGSSPSLAQFSSAARGYSGGSPAIGVNPMANPYLNPYANPYVNPYANPYVLPMAGGSGMGGLYAFSAATSITGIGSGQASGSRGVVTSGSGAGAQPAAPNDRTDTTFATPGAGASRYFQGAYGPTTGVDRYFGRHNRHFQSNRP